MNILIHYIAYSFLIFASATIVFDTIHYLSHRWHDHSFRLLRCFSKMQHLSEVWGVGSEIECHPAILPSVYEYKKSKRTYARWVRKFTAQNQVIYRHIVPAAFHSGMGYGLMTAKFVARSIIFLAKRDCRYIPITYSSIALLNYFKFKLLGGFISKATV